MKHLMLDLETFGTSSNSLIISISALEFDPFSIIEEPAEFTVGLSVLEQLLLPKTEIDFSTVSWWQTQSQEAKNRLIAISAYSLQPALQAFVTFLTIIDPKLDISLWGNGATFDCVLLRNLFLRAGIKFPLPYWADKDVRTLTQLVDYDTVKTITGDFVGVKHNAIDDCKHQVKLIHSSLNVLKEKLNAN